MIKHLNYLLSMWHLSLEKHPKVFNDPIRPWYTSGAINWLDDHVNSEMVVLEYGAGSSSLWWCMKAKEVHSIEANLYWASQLCKEFAARPELLKKWRFHVSPSEWRESVEAPKSYWRKHKNVLREEDIKSMEECYLLHIPRNFDVVVVDGALRKKTLLKARELSDKTNVKIIVVDNTNNNSISKTADKYLSDSFKRMDFPAIEEDKKFWKNPKWNTSIFVR